jgi:hypothetical protein
VTAAVLALALAPTTAATAASAGVSAHAPGPKAHAKKKPPRLGMLVVCNHTGYVFGVYADGPSIREDDIAGSFDECTDWKPVKAGDYDIGFTMRTPSQQPATIQARIERHGVTYYQTFNSQGTLDVNVGAKQVTKIDLFIPQG